MPVKLDSVKYVKVYNSSIGVAVGEVSPEITAITRTTGEAASVGTTEAPVITVNGKALELEDGVYTYEVPMSGTIEVTAALDGGYVWINNDQDGTYNEENVVSGRIVRVLAQKGESQPVIYYLTMVSSVAGDEDVAEVEELIAAIGDVTLAKENQINAARAAYNALPAALQSQVSNYAVLTAAEARLQELKGGSDGPIVDNTINVSFRLIGAELAEDDVDLGTVVYRPYYVTWVNTTEYELEKGSTVYDLFVEAMNDAGLTQVGAENNYVATIYAPSGYELSEFTNGNRSGWMYTINGSHPGFGLRQQTLRDGDVVVWHYVNDYAWEVEDWSAIGGGQWPQESTSEKNYWNGWLMAPDRIGGMGGGLYESADPSAPDAPAETLDPVTGFEDISKDAYYYNAVKWAASNGITTGTSYTTFSPDDSCTRAQMITLLWRAVGEPKAKNTTCVFTDVDKDAYYYDAVLWAVEKGITTGTSATTFSPDAVCTRAQIVTFLFRTTGYNKVTYNHGFEDVAADAYYISAVSWAAIFGVTNGTSETTFSPDAVCTRAQAATFLYRYLGK